MKKIFNYILAVTALLAFAPIAKAQDDYTIKNGIGVRKTISAPNLNGEYFITLESFVEGEVKITPKPIPADIVLVLDVSASMVRTNMGAAGEEEYVAINNSQNGVSGRVLTVGWSYNDWTDNLYIEYPYGSENFCKIERDGRRLTFKYNNTDYWLTGGGTSDNNGTGIIGGTWGDNVTNHDGEIAKASAGTYNYGNSITTNQPAEVAANNTVIWRGPLYQKTNNFTRLHALQNAVATFLNVVHQKSVEDKLNNRISIVKFSGVYVNDPDGADALKQGNHYSDTDGGKTTEVFQGWTNTSNRTEIDNVIKDIKHIATGHGTSQDFGLNLAQKLLASLPADTEPRSKTVVLFTDGDPWRASDLMTPYTENTSSNITNYAIAKSYDIKHTKAFTSTNPDGTSEDHYVTIFTVGTLGTGTAPDQANNIMNYCSSKYPEAKNISNHGSAVEGDYVFRAETAAQLDAVFTAIANSSSESSTSLDAETTTTVDIVSKSFMLPSGASTNVQVFTADCNGGKYVEQDGERVFVPKFASQVPDAALTESVVIKKSSGSTKYDEVDVTGFDYTANFCGPRVDTQSGDTLGFVGKKLIVKFPVKMDPEALGGPNAPTNAPGSGIFADGQDEPVATFETPHVSLPYNIHITKTGLEKGESARFKIEKIIVQDAWITTDAEGKETINVPVNAQWDPMTTVLITADGVTTEPGIWVRGLPSTQAVGTEQKIVLYRVSEDPWSWSYDRKTNPMITDNSKIDNPFQFVNVKMNDQKIKIKVRHAESKARNIFKLNTEGGGVEYMDSKNEREKKAVK
jgi:hypothetical protein